MHAYPDEDKIVTDPGFPGLGGRCAYISFGKRFAKNCIKIEEIGPRGSSFQIKVPITVHGFPHEN